MAEIFIKENPNVEFEEEFPSYITIEDIKEEILDMKCEDENLDVCKIKNELLDTPIKADTDRNDFVIQELTHEVIIKAETSKEGKIIPISAKKSGLSKRRHKQGFTKKKWLKRWFQRLNGHFYTPSRKASKTRGFASSTDQNVSSLPSKCFFCYFCVKPFLSAPQFRNHFIRRHLVVKSSTSKLRLGYVMKNSSLSNLNWKAPEFLIKHKVTSKQKMYSNLRSFNKCNFCLKTFKTKDYLKLHMNIHSDVKTFKCKICSKEFTHKGNFNAHLKAHTSIKPLKCEICSKEFTWKVNLNAHMNWHVGIRPFKCEICPKQFTLKSTLNRHVKLHTDIKPFKCKVCSKEFTQKYDLNIHLNIHTDIKLFKCEICTLEFSLEKTLNEHVKSHAIIKPFKCEICSREITLLSNFNAHIKAHADIKPCKCEICFKKFARKHDLNAHMNMHVGTKLFKCEICSKQYPLKSTLNKHVKLHTGIKPFKCTVCSKAFTEKNNLNTHMNVHADIKPFQCEICSESRFKCIHKFTHRC